MVLPRITFTLRLTSFAKGILCFGYFLSFLQFANSLQAQELAPRMFVALRFAADDPQNLGSGERAVENARQYGTARNSAFRSVPQNEGQSALLETAQDEVVARRLTPFNFDVQSGFDLVVPSHQMDVVPSIDRRRPITAASRFRLWLGDAVDGAEGFITLNGDSEGHLPSDVPNGALDENRRFVGFAVRVPINDSLDLTGALIGEELPDGEHTHSDYQGKLSVSAAFRF